MCYSYCLCGFTDQIVLLQVRPPSECQSELFACICSCHGPRLHRHGHRMLKIVSINFQISFHWKNQPGTAYFPTQEQPGGRQYRSTTNKTIVATIINTIVTTTINTIVTTIINTSLSGFGRLCWEWENLLPNTGLMMIKVMIEN